MSAWPSLPCIRLLILHLRSLFCLLAGEARDVWSEGFPDLAVLKPACVLACLHLGRDVLWMDTDIVLFESPLDHFDPNFDLAIQVSLGLDR